MKKFGYFTLATDDFVVGSCCLAKSLKRLTKIPLYCIGLNLKHDSKQKLSDAGWQVIDTSYLGSKTCKHQPYRDNPNFANNCYNKIHLWNQDFDKIVYLDSDIICLKNPDNLFEIKGSFAASSSLRTTLNAKTRKIISMKWADDYFNAGVLVIEPNKKVFNDLFVAKDFITTPKDPSDQGLLNHYFSNSWTRLPPVYNFAKRFFDVLPQKWEELKTKIYILHYTVEKPWTTPPEKDFLIKLWWQINIG